MGIFLRHSYNVKPPRWGSPADVQFAIKVNAEKIYDVDPDSNALIMPGFWGLPLLDYSGKNNHGTNHGAIYKGGSLNFDGTNDYIDFSDNALLHLSSGNFTITTHIYPHFDIDTAADDSALIWKQDSGSGTLGPSYILKIDSNNSDCIQFVAWNPTDSIAVNITGNKNTWNANQWYTIELVFDGSGYQFYVDGVPDGYTADTDQPEDNTGNLNIGAALGGTDQPFNGLIDEVRISNTDRTANQIALFHDLPWALYQPVSRPVYFFQAAVGVTMPIFMSNYLRQMGA